MLSKDDIVNVEDIHTETLHIPEWQGEVTLRTLSAAERDAWEFSVYGDGKTDAKTDAQRRMNFRATLCVRCMIDDKGARIFADNEARMLGVKSGCVVDRIFSVCQRMNALTQTDVDGLEKNSEPDLADSSHSD